MFVYTYINPMWILVGWEKQLKDTIFNGRPVRYVAPQVWNSLPTEIRQSCNNLLQFKSKLKTFLFQQSWALLWIHIYNEGPYKYSRLLYYYYYLRSWYRQFNQLWLCSVAYLGFRKGGGKFSLATSAHTKEGSTKFSNFFFNVKKKLTKGGPWPNGPLNTPLIMLMHA